MKSDMGLLGRVAADGAISGFEPYGGPPVARSNEDVACVLLSLARELLQHTHPAISHMIRYAVIELDEARS